MNKVLSELKNKLKEIMRSTNELEHGEETLKWLLKIAPTACWQIQIAALAHDIERAVPYIPGVTPPKVKAEGMPYDLYKQNHAHRSALIVSHIMKQMEFSEDDINQVTNTISRHETGGDTGSDLVRDADSLHWFDTGYKMYREKYGLKGAKEKALWMYNRTTARTKKLIDTLDFEAAIRTDLDKYTGKTDCA